MIFYTHENLNILKKIIFLIKDNQCDFSKFFILLLFIYLGTAIT